jgi:hypothetical protein
VPTNLLPCWVQTPPLRVKTNAAPALERDHPLCRGATPRRRPGLGGANRQHGPWRLSNSLALTIALPNAFLASLGLASLAVAKAT